MIDKPSIADAVKSTVPAARIRGAKSRPSKYRTGSNFLDCCPRERAARSEREHDQAQL
jgi:hypothetical protein